MRVAGRVEPLTSGRPHLGAMVFAGAAALAVLVATSILLPDRPAATVARPQATPRVTSAPTVAVPRPSPDELDSAWVSQSPVPPLAVGEEATLTFRFKNTGKATWSRGTPSEAGLAFTGDARRFDPRMAVGWPQPDRPAVQTEDAVAPGQTATFSFRVRGVAPGTFRIDLRPIVAAVGWLRDEGVYAEVLVR